jgi:hypothetical protein
MNQMHKISKILTFLIVSFLTSSLAIGQNTTFIEEQEEFGNSVALVLNSPIGVEFQELWYQQNFTTEHKTLIQSNTKKLLDFRFKVRSQFVDFFTAINAAVRTQNMQGEDLTGFLETTLKVVENYNRNDISKYLKDSKNFLQGKILYDGNIYALMAKGGNFKFKFIDGNEEVPEVEIEEIFQEEEVEEAQAELDWSTINWDDLGKSTDEATVDDVSRDFVISDVNVIQPPVQGAVIEFEEIDLAFINRQDTTFLLQTKGSFMINTGQFVGEEGRINWKKEDVLSPEIYADFDKYNFLVKDNKLTADNVLLHYSEKLEEPVKGILEYIGQQNSQKGTSYPRFKSYQSNIRITNFGHSNVVYEGGVALRGSNLYSASTNGELAVLEGSNDGRRRFKATSGLFNFQEADSTITARIAAVIIYQGNDSIYHPAVSFEYETDNAVLRLKSAKGGFRNTPYNSSYFNMDFNADLIEWDIKEDSLDISVVTARNEKPVVIESRDYFRRDRFDALSSLHNFHPLIILVNYSRKVGSVEFSLLDIVEETKLSEPLLRKTMMDLMQNGLVDFDSEAGYITINRKGYHYYLSQRRQKDYDDMIIPSIIGSAPNATLYIEDNVMKMRGVKSFYVSDSLDVIINPTNNEVNILKNRDIQFDGSMYAGNFQFVGQKMTFKYDSFLVDLPQLDWISLMVGIENGNRKRLDNQLVETSGTLYINKRNNKSGLRTFVQYPIFNTNRNAIIYFDKPTILEQAYDSTVFFTVPPFELDSAADADPSTLAFEGTLTSGGIFPDFQERIVANPDNSLGFLHSIPIEGYSLYGTEVLLFDDVTLNADGLSSGGDIKYLTSQFEVERSTFYLDSLDAENGIIGSVGPGRLNEISFPSVQFKDYNFKWLVKQDSLIVTNKTVPFQFYDSIANFNGSMVIRSIGLIGAGEFEIEGSKTISEDYNFEETRFGARHAKFDIGSENQKKKIMSGLDVKLDYNLEASMAEINPEEQGDAALEFPFAQFKTSIPSATWDINNNIITMFKPDSVDINQSYFYTTNIEKDSLVFNATGAIYDIDSLKLRAEGIPYITVADARITPEGNTVDILENSKIGTLRNAVVIMDTANGYHRLYDATIDIKSRTEFSGEGTYELINAVQDTFAIKFNAFVTQESEEFGRFTKSSGGVSPNDNIVVSPGFTFKGDVHMYAYRKALELDGAVRLNFEKLKERNVWIEYASNDSIQEVIVDFDNTKTEGGDALNAGLHFNRGDIYLSFITEKRGMDDDDFFIPKGGLLTYKADSNENTYRIQSPEKVDRNSYAGSMFSYNEKTQDVKFEGSLNFIGPNNLGIEVQGAGIGSGNLDSASFDIDALMTLDFAFPDETFALMAADLKLMGDELGIKKAHDDRSDLIYKVAEVIGNEATKSWDNLNLASYSPLVLTSEKLLKDLVITNVDLKWSKQNKAFYSVGKIGLSNVGNVDLNIEVDGLIEIRKTPAGDMINVLLQMTDGTWYYFGYDGTSLASFSSNPAFNNVVLAKSNIGKARIGTFTFFAATIEEVMVWAQSFKKLYYGLDEPYRLLMANESSQTVKKKTTEEGDGF